MNKTEYNIEDGIVKESNKNEQFINEKCSRTLLKATFAFVVGAVFIGYFIAVSRNSNLKGNYLEFHVGNVTDSSIPGKFF